MLPIGYIENNDKHKIITVSRQYANTDDDDGGGGRGRGRDDDFDYDDEVDDEVDDDHVNGVSGDGGGYDDDDDNRDHELLAYYAMRSLYYA